MPPWHVSGGPIREDESGLLFLVTTKKGSQDTYPWYQRKKVLRLIVTLLGRATTQRVNPTR